MNEWASRQRHDVIVRRTLAVAQAALLCTLFYYRELAEMLPLAAEEEITPSRAHRRPMA